MEGVVLVQVACLLLPVSLVVQPKITESSITLLIVKLFKQYLQHDEEQQVEQGEQQGEQEEQGAQQAKTCQ